MAASRTERATTSTRFAAAARSFRGHRASGGRQPGDGRRARHEPDHPDPIEHQAMTPTQSATDQPVIVSLEQFDRQSGSLPERLLFNHRWVVVLACLLVTVVL